jgi:hypothetical protein
MASSSTRRVLLQGLPGLAVTGGAGFGYVTSSQCNDDDAEKQRNKSLADEQSSLRELKTKFKKQNLSILQRSTSRSPCHKIHCSLPGSVNTISGHDSTQFQATSPAHEGRSIQADFVIVGHGSAGKAAHATLLLSCPGAKIAIIDPYTSEVSSNSTTFVNHVPLDLNICNKEVTLSNGCVIRYSQSILIATGSRGAPPPSDLIHPTANSRVLELRSTTLPAHVIGAHREWQGKSSSTETLPPRVGLSPMAVRGIGLMAASQNASVCVLGSGLEAVELAAALSATKLNRRNSKRRNGDGSSTNESTGRISLVFGNAAPLSTELPRYLCAALSKRLRQQGIDVYERRGVRYVSLSNNISHPSNMPTSVEVHVAKTADTMDTRRLSTDLIIGKSPCSFYYLLLFWNLLSLIIFYYPPPHSFH